MSPRAIALLVTVSAIGFLVVWILIVGLRAFGVI